MKTYDGSLIQRHISETVLVDDNGNPPALGETVTIGGRLAEVTSSNQELLNDSGTGGRFVAAFKP
jgi:hypothetical protein